MTIMSDFSESIVTSSLSNPETYKENLIENLEDILIKYNQLINDYISLYIDNIKIVNKSYYYYLFLNGIKTINNVFLNILLYTKNLTISNFFGQKSYYLYIEFISQIDNINHSFLQLNGKDASLFVYKKTIYELDNNIIKDYKCNNKEKFNIISQFVNLVYNFYSINNIENNVENIKEIINYDKININNILQQIIDILCVKNVKNIANKNILIMESITKYIDYLKIELKNEDKLSNKLDIYVSMFIEKLKITNITNNILKNINSFNIEDINNKNPKKFIDNIFIN
jgi:hypothetical protein